MVDVEWNDYEGKSGMGIVVYLVDDFVFFWFFDVVNWEFLFKIFDGCGVNGYYWVYLVVIIDVEYWLWVMDI